MKNDTKITPRLETILNILAAGPASRLTIQNQLSHSLFPLARLALLRDLAKLIDQGQIVTTGRGRSTLYQLAHFNPLLTPPAPRPGRRGVFLQTTVFGKVQQRQTPHGKKQR